MQKKQLFLLLFFVFALSVFAQKPPFVFYPSLNSDGSQLAFSFQGDIWTAPSTGGDAVRLTIHEAYEGKPKWSPDNSQIAFSSDRFGNDDIFVIPAKGGTARQLTFHSHNDELTDWTSENDLVFITDRAFQQVEWNDEVYSISANGGTEQRILNTVGDMATVSPDGKFVAFVKGYRTTREEYHGSANYDIWIYNTTDNTFKKITDFDGHDWMPQWGDSRTIYYISAESGRYNVQKLTIDDSGTPTGKPEQLTNYKEDGLRYLSVSRDGSTLAFSRQTDVYVMKTNGGSPQKVNINISADYRFDPIEYKTYTSDANEYAVSPNGKLMAFVVRGEVFIKEVDKEESKSKNLTNNPANDEMVEFLNDSTLLFVSDRNEQQDLFLVRSADKDQPDLFKTLKYETKQITDSPKEEHSPVVSPDHKKLAFTVGNGKLIVADISDDGSLSNDKTLLDGWAEPEDIAWSPDSKWLAYSITDLYYNNDIFIQAADNSAEPVNVSMHPRGDYSPFWSKDGSKLGFVSERNASNYDVWFAWLKKADWEKTKEDWKDKDEEDTPKKKDEKKDDEAKEDKDAVEPIQIDFENIYRRLTQVTRLSGDETNYVISNDGETFYFTASSPADKGQNLYSVKWDGTELKPVMEGGKSPAGLYLDPDGKYIYYFQRGGSLGRFEISSSKSEGFPYKAEVAINYNEELSQIFDEAWRALNENFYDPGFHGHDFKALKEKYKPWALVTSTRTDFRTIFNEMLGQINASHMGLYRVEERGETQKLTTGLLGVEIKPLDKGVKITKVVPNTPADKEASKLNVGDVILAVDSKPVSSDVNFFSLFMNKSNDKVLLSVKDKDDAEREVVIRPTTSISNDLYEEWVQERRDLTEKYSNGRLGYIHIKGMDMPSFEEFERELTASGLNKEGLVVDVRYNGGGWTTDYLMMVLNYKQHAYNIPRGAAENLEKEKTKFRGYYPIGERLPYAAWLKPSIALCNQNSYSNAEIFSHAYKTLGIGKLVGVQTFGAVISTGGHTLIDGSYVRLPGRGWYVKADDQNMDFKAAIPDFIIDNEPDSKVKGEDPQLKKAVDELLKEIDNK